MSKSVFSYGVCYVGSKNKICKWLTDLLPAGERFIDLFGGGGAATHAAVLSGKYKEVVYSDINPFIVKLLQKAVNGDYEYDRFTPYWCDRELFMKSKNDINADPYIKYAFSFGAGGNTYLGTGEALARERAGHNWCVRGELMIGSRNISTNPSFLLIIPIITSGVIILETNTGKNLTIHLALERFVF